MLLKEVTFCLCLKCGKNAQINIRSFQTDKITLVGVPWTHLRYLLELDVGVAAFLRRLHCLLVVVYKGLVHAQLTGL